MKRDCDCDISLSLVLGATVILNVIFVCVVSLIISQAIMNMKMGWKVAVKEGS